MVNSAAQPRPERPPWWQGPLLVGVCFALGYGITQRLMALSWPQFVQLGQGFEVRAFPGTSLESLRLRFGAEGQTIRADLERQELEQQSQQAEQQQQQDQEQEQERQRQDAIQRQQEEEQPLRFSNPTPAPAAAGSPPRREEPRRDGLLEPPPAPVLPPPDAL
jgi:hypothetical protein